MTGIVKKISAIIKKADSTTSPEEAETFMAKVHQMMMENGLSILDPGKLEDDTINHDIDCMCWYGGYHGKIAFSSSMWPCESSLNKGNNCVYAGNEDDCVFCYQPMERK